MAKVRFNGRDVHFDARRQYRVRKRARRLERRNANGTTPRLWALNSAKAALSPTSQELQTDTIAGQLLKTVMQQLWNRYRKQDNRWLQAKVKSMGRSVIPHPIEQELVQLFRAPSKREQEKPKLRPDLRLSPEAMQLWQELKIERKAAMIAQGQNFEAEDWWLDGKGGEEGKKSKTRAQMEDTAATMEMLGARGEEYVEEDEEGNFVFLSPEGSVVGEEDEVEEIDGGGGTGGSLVLPIREATESARM